MSSSTIDDELVIRAAKVVLTDAHLTVDLVDGRTITVPLAWYPRLVHGTPAERSNVEIGPFGLHWPDLDEDISIRGLLLGHRSGESDRSFRQWLDYRSRGQRVPVPEYPLDDHDDV
jgi:hypothetical protein